MATLRFFRDSLRLDDGLLNRLIATGVTPRGGDTLVLGAATCTLLSLQEGFNYLILADTLFTSASPFVVPDSTISIFANSITSSLRIETPGSPGADGEPGEPGEDGEVITDPPPPRQLAGGPGGPGSPGEDGHAGGSVTIRYASSAVAPTASAPGGPGGSGGAGGAGGAGRPPGRPGRGGKRGRQGTPGSISILQVPAGQVFQGLEPDTLAGWSDYRSAVGEYYFRLFDPNSQLRALAEFDAAIRLNPANTRAATLRRRLIQQQTPSGVPRDLDIAPDVKDLSVGLLGETQLVLSQFLAVQETATQLEIATATKDQLGLVVHQLRDRMNEAQLDVVSARGGVQAATANRNMYDDQVVGLEGQMLALDHAPLSLGDQVMTLGAMAAAVAGLATGAGAIVSIPGAIAAAENPESGIVKVLRFLADGKSFWDEKDFGGDIKELMQGGQDVVVNLNKVSEQASGSSSDQKIAQLAMQEVNVRRQLMVANLRLQQVQDQLHAAEARVVDYGAEVQAATGLLDNWSATESFLNGALGVLLNVARRLADMVSEDIFLARRALEIYQLEDASNVRFDYGLLHPDRDSDLALQPLTRAQLSLQSVSTMPADVITWNRIFVQLNEAQTSGFDVVHPSIEVVIDDPAALAHLKQGGGMTFSVGIGPTPASATIPARVLELKVNTLILDLVGASATGAALLWVQHSGHWLMARRPRPPAPNPPAIEFMLLPHVEAFNFGAGSNVLSAAIPAQPPSTAHPGPPFSFWGRGALADWTLFPDPSARTLNLGALSSVRFTIGCIGLVPQGVVVPPVFRVSPQPVPVPPREVVKARLAQVSRAQILTAA